MLILRRGVFFLPISPLASSSPADLFRSESAFPDVARGGHSVRADQPPDYPWVALGDSFAAGPGAGDPFDEEATDCLRNNGAYPPQLNKDFPYPNPAMQFLACSGHEVPQLIDIQVPAMDEDQQALTMSIGGNDLGFPDILKACIFKPGGPFSADCDETIAKTREFVAVEFKPTLKKGYDAVFKKIPDDYRRVMLVQLYPSFFNFHTDWCDTQTMGLIPGYKPLLTKELRTKLNDLADEVRLKMSEFIENYDGPNGNWPEPRVWAVDRRDNQVYPGHRFCEPDKETLDDESIWFFVINGDNSPKITAKALLQQVDSKTCFTDPKYKSNFTFSWYCDSARYVATQGGEQSDLLTIQPESFLKAFHPKTAAFTVIKDIHKAGFLEVGYPRQTNVDQGLLQCKPPAKEGDPDFYASRDDMMQATKDFCAATASAGVLTNEGIFKGQHVSATLDRDTKNCPKTDVTSKGFIDLCTSRLMHGVDGCDLKKGSSDLWKQGGTFYRDCVTWYVGRRVQKENWPADKLDNLTLASKL